MRPVLPREFVLPGFHLYRGAHAGGSLLARHTHDDPSLCYVFSGRFTEQAAGITYDCGPDTLKLTVAGDPHCNRFIARQSHGLRVDIRVEAFADSVAVRALLDDRLYVDRAGVRGVMDRIAAEWAVPDDAAELIMQGLLLELLGRLARERGLAGDAVPAWLPRARDMVESLYATRLTLAVVAREVGVSTTQLARAWRRAYRTSIGERVRTLRVQRAVHELRTSDATLADIALRCGFYDQSHLTNVFRREVGTSPARFRIRA